MLEKVIEKACELGMILIVIFLIRDVKTLAIEINENLISLLVQQSIEMEDGEY